MARSSAELGQTLNAARETLAKAIVDRQYLLHPELEARFGPQGRQKCYDDTGHLLAYLAEALTASAPSIFREYIAWAKVALTRHGIPLAVIADNLETAAAVLKEHLPADDAACACGYLEGALADLPAMAASLPSFIIAAQPYSELAKSYLSALIACERHKASSLILDAVKSGTSIKDIYIHVFQQSQREIGRLWQINQMTVAQEHYCTAATQMIMSQLYPQIFAGPKNGRRFVGACVAGDLHEIGMRMVADFFEMDGWDTVYLGASVPVSDLIKTLLDRKPEVLGISATIAPHVHSVAEMIAAIRATPGCRNTIILVGGYPFLVTPDLRKQVGADGTCLDAQGAVELANQLIQSKAAA